MFRLLMWLTISAMLFSGILLAVVLVITPKQHGEEIAYISGALRGQRYDPRVYLLDLAYRLEVNLTSSSTNGLEIALAWSPDGTRLAYSSLIAGRNQGISIFDLATYTEQQLVIAEVESLGAPDWSPDSQYLAVTAYSLDTGWQIYTVDVSRQPFSYALLLSDLRHPPSPRWSPDGSELVYLAPGQSAGSRHLQVLTAASGESRRITPDYGLLSPGAWSPDNQWITYSGAGPDGRIGSFVFDLAAQTEKWLNSSFLSQPPVWSPDGQYLVWYGEDGAIYQQAIRTGEITTLYDGSDANIKRPIWSPDGTRLVFSLNRRLAVLNLENDSLQIISSAGSPQSVYAWRP